MKARLAMQLDREGCKWSVLVAAAVLMASVSAIAQGGEATAALQQKMAAVKESVAENKQRLHQYQWLETTQFSLKGRI